MVEQRIVVCADDRRQARIVGAVAPACRGLFVQSPGLVAHLDRNDAVAAVIDASFHNAALESRMASLSCRGVPWPAIWIGVNDRTHLGRSAGGSATWLAPNELQKRLPTVLRRALIDWRLARAAERTHSRHGTAELLREALSAMLSADPPMLSVTGVAAICGVSRSHLLGMWRDDFMPVLHEKLRYVVDWVLLLRAAGLKSPSRTWAAVAHHLGTTRERLERLAMARLGRDLESMEKDVGVAAVSAFDERVLRAAGIAERRSGTSC